MQTNLAEWARDSKLGQEADDILRRCVHCGFCTATCPTYQVLGDELDSPRGRIYLIKEVLEGKEPTQATQQHLDRCLTCRNCETTCPSGVQYGHLVDIGRQIVEEKVERPMMQRLQRTLLRKGLVSPCLHPPISWVNHCAAYCHKHYNARSLRHVQRAPFRKRRATSSKYCC